MLLLMERSWITNVFLWRKWVKVSKGSRCCRGVTCTGASTSPVREAGAWTCPNSFHYVFSLVFYFSQVMQNCCMFLLFTLSTPFDSPISREPLWPKKLLTRSSKLVSVSFASRQGAWPRSNIHSPVCHLLEVSSHFKSPLAGGFDLWHPWAFFFSSPTSGPFQMHGQMNMRRPDCQDNR